MQNLKILLFESIAADAELINKYLERSDLVAETTIASNHADLVKALLENTFDIILGDYSLASLEAVRIARAKDKYIPFILVSDVVEVVAIKLVKNQKADDYISINHLDRLPTAIQQAMKHRETTRAKEACEISLAEKSTLNQAAD